MMDLWFNHVKSYTQDILAENADNLKPEDMAQVVCDICALPEHVVVEETTVWGRAQVVRPL